MRTKLDEIVESEYEATKYNVEEKWAALRRIAERAFRHGVERAEDAHSVSLWGIEPGPAAEEKREERRKGERRKGKEICPHAPELSGRCFVFTRTDGTIYHAGDSRHGPDRRKG